MSDALFDCQTCGGELLREADRYRCGNCDECYTLAGAWRISEIEAAMQRMVTNRLWSYPTISQVVLEQMLAEWRAAFGGV